MSAHPVSHGDHGHHDHHGHGEAHGSMREYVIGFVLSVILTAIPFWLVMGEVLDKHTTIFLVLGLGAVQIVVHVVYFLHMNARSEGGWNLLAMIFTIILVVITLAGSLWVMNNMAVNMMPSMDAHSARTAP